jgi:hypothetical protein
MRLFHYTILCGLALMGLALGSRAEEATRSGSAEPVATPTAAAPTGTAALMAAWTSTAGLDPNNGISGQDRKPVVELATGVHPVKVVKTDGKWQLTRDGKPYSIKGVGGDSEFDRLVQMGGNSVRIWGIDGKTGITLNECAKRDLTVLLGYWVGQKKVGFRSDDPATQKNMLEEFKRVVKIYKDHPAVLAWAIGNEMENGNDTPALWKSIQELAKACHEIDPNHPTMTVVAEMGGSHAKMIHELCPDIDIVGINSYAGGPSVGERYLKQVPGGQAKPYVITEFGPPGQWEYWIKTSFGTVTEMTSTEKVKWYKDTYEKTILGHSECLGGYAFLWGFKPEATVTWYGMFLPDGRKTGAVDAMQELWSGKKTDAPCPVLKKISLNGGDSVEAGATLNASVDANDPGGGKLTYEWTMHGEMSMGTTEPGTPPPPSFPDAIQKNGEPQVTLKMPAQGGTYRIYCYVRNDRGGAATGTLTVRVK